MMYRLSYIIIGILLFDLCDLLFFKKDKKKVLVGILIGLVILILLLIYEYAGGR